MIFAQVSKIIKSCYFYSSFNILNFKNSRFKEKKLIKYIKIKNEYIIILGHKYNYDGFINYFLLNLKCIFKITVHRCDRRLFGLSLLSTLFGFGLLSTLYI